MMKDEIFYIVFSTCPDKESAQLIAKTLVKENLAKCVQIGSPIKSTYVWRGEFCIDEEIPVTIKLSSKTLKLAEKKYADIHPYDCPEWLTAKVDASLSYAKWLAE